MAPNTRSLPRGRLLSEAIVLTFAVVLADSLLDLVGPLVVQNVVLRSLFVSVPGERRGESLSSPSTPTGLHTHRVTPFLLHLFPRAWGCRPRASYGVRGSLSPAPSGTSRPVLYALFGLLRNISRLNYCIISDSSILGVRKGERGAPGPPRGRDSRSSTYKRRLNRLAQSGPVAQPPIGPPCEGWISVRSPGKGRKKERGSTDSREEAACRPSQNAEADTVDWPSRHVLGTVQAMDWR